MRLVSFIIILSLSFFSLKAQLVTYPDGLRTGIPHNDDFTVRVRTKGGEWKETFEYRVHVDMDRVQEAVLSINRWKTVSCLLLTNLSIFL